YGFAPLRGELVCPVREIDGHALVTLASVDAIDPDECRVADAGHRLGLAAELQRFAQILEVLRVAGPKSDRYPLGRCPKTAGRAFRRRHTVGVADSLGGGNRELLEAQEGAGVRRLCAGRVRERADCRSRDDSERIPKRRAVWA